MGLVLIILGAVVFLGSIAILGVLLHKFCKSLTLGGTTLKVEGKTKWYFIALISAGALGFLLLSLGMVNFNQWAFDAGNYLTIIFGSIFVGGGISLFVSSFTIFFARKDLEQKQRKVAQICLISAICMLFAGLWMWTDSFALFIEYPLPNSISFKTGLGYPKSGDYGVTIAFYGIIIVGGAIVSYFVADHIVYTKYGKHGLLDTLFLVAFLMGLIGGRLWWCCVLEPSKIFYGSFGESFLRLVDVRSGGMAIQGGALLGMISGIWFAMTFRKYINIRWLVDAGIPTILLAQAIGRWGNFFNQEVFGMSVDPSVFAFLPKMVQQNMFIYSKIDHIVAFRVPLFLIESVINMAGYFIIRYAIGRGLKKFLRQGDQAFMYVAWYGLVRICLEPLREGFTLNLGSSEAFGYLQSWIVAFSFLAVGILGMVGLRIFEHIRRSKGFEVKEYEAI